MIKVKSKDLNIMDVSNVSQELMITEGLNILFKELLPKHLNTNTHNLLEKLVRTYKMMNCNTLLISEKTSALMLGNFIALLVDNGIKRPNIITTYQCMKHNALWVVAEEIDVIGEEPEREDLDVDK